MTFDEDNDYDTTVLSDDYSDYQDTVVDQVIAFDPSLFQGAAGEMAQQAQRPTWVSAGSSQQSSAPQKQQSAQPDQQPAQPEQRPVWSQPQPVWSQPQPTWEKADPSASAAPRNYNPEEDTWVLGTPQLTQRSSAVSQPAAAVAQRVPSPAAAQRPSANWQSAPRTTRTMMAAADSKPGKANRLFIGLIIGLAVVGVVALIVALAFVLAKPDEGPKSTESAPAVVASSSSSSSAAEEGTDLSEQAAPVSESAASPDKQSNTTLYMRGEDNGAGNGSGKYLTDSEAYRLLKKYYDKAGDFHNAIVDCAADFNATYQNESKQVRSANASTVSSLKAQVKSAWDDVKDIEMPFWSKNIEAKEQLVECYECLWHRLDAIDKAWQIDLQYDKPKEHDAEIVAPLRAQQVNGNDKYFTRFKELYPSINLTKP